MQIISNKNTYIYGMGDRGRILAAHMSDVLSAPPVGFVVSDGFRRSTEYRTLEGTCVPIFELGEITPASDIVFMNTVASGRASVLSLLDERGFCRESFIDIPEDDFQRMSDEYWARFREYDVWVYDDMFRWQRVISCLSDIHEIPLRGIIVPPGTTDDSAFTTLNGRKLPIKNAATFIRDVQRTEKTLILNLESGDGVVNEETKADMVTLCDKGRHLDLRQEECSRLLGDFKNHCLRVANVGEDAISRAMKMSYIDFFQIPFKEPSFPKGAVSESRTFRKPEDVIRALEIAALAGRHRIAAVMAIFNAGGIINDDLMRYMKELRRHTTAMIAISDSPILPGEMEKFRDVADEAIFARHGGYDFGSYKRGYFALKNNGILDHMDKLLFCNDSVLFTGHSLDDVFQGCADNDVYTITLSSGPRSIRVEFAGYDFYYPAFDDPCESWDVHSYFISMSKNVFCSDWFNDFMASITNERDKLNVCAKYEGGLSNLLMKHCEVRSYYPPLIGDPNSGTKVLWQYLSAENREPIFLKKSTMN